jgi:hypothetical protein
MDLYDTVDWELLVPLPDGSEELIQQYDAHHCKKILGMWLSPSGEEGSQLGRFWNGWKNELPDGEWSSPGKFAWVSYKLKLWLGLFYGLATLANPFCTAASLLDSFHFLCSHSCINRNIKSEWSTLPWAFGGIRLFS